MMEHLDDQSWRALEQGDPDATAHFTRHLADGCDTCEAFLEAAPLPPELEGAVEVALAGPPAVDAAPDEVGYARLRRRLGLGRGRAARVVTPLAAVAAVLLAVVLAPRVLRQADLNHGIKATGAAVALELSAVVQRPDGALRPVSSGQTLAAGGVVLFRYHASEVARGALVRVDAAGAQVLAEVALQPGTHDLRVEGELVGAPVSGSGAVRFLLVASPGEQPIDLADALRVAAEPTSARAGWAADGILLHVEEPPNP